MSEEIREANKRLNQEINGHKKITEGLKTARDWYRSLFENMSISLWEEDFSSVKTYLDDLRKKGIEHFSEYFENNPQEVENCVDMVRVTDINRATLKMYKASNKKKLLSGLSQVFTEDTYRVFQEELIALAMGRTHFESETLTRTLNGDDKYVHLTLSVAPGYQDTWKRVLLSLTDITARKQAEEELRSNHEYLEKLNNSLQEVIFRVKLPERTIAYVNRAVRSIFGYEEETRRAFPCRSHHHLL